MTEILEDQIIPTDLRGEMSRSYLEYAMSVIVGRALPDAPMPVMDSNSNTT